MKAWSFGVAVAALAFAGVADAKDGSIVEVARAAGSFKTLVAAVEAADLARTLDQEGPFTVFAPTDEAFAALPAGTVEALLRDPARLRRILLHHVARGTRPASEVVTFDSVRTLADTTLPIVVRGGTVSIGDARVVTADVHARNGVIHVIDRVLLPPAAHAPAAAAPAPAPTIAAVAKADGRFGTLLAAVEAAGLVGALTGPGPLTVFAPTDAAFAALPPAALQGLLGDKARLARLLTHHVVAGRLAAADVVGRTSLTTLAGTTLRVDARDGVFVAGARVVAADVAAGNGVIHVLDRVLLPPPAEVGTSAAPAAPAGGARFPALVAKNLEGQRYELPGGLGGERNLCLIAFRQWQQREVDTWLRWLDQAPLRETPGFQWWEFPTIERMGEAMERFVDAGMARGIRERAARARTITLWTDRQAFFDALEIPGDRTIQVVLVDREGRVLWRTEGAFTPEKGAALARALGVDG